jgi:DNA-directed RNA polymerase subunit alpha
MIPLPTKLNILQKGSKKLAFEIWPLYPGYGVTLGNALRRILLSSIEGAAITKATFKNVPHEFSVIEGMKEDVLDFCLNLKQVRLKIFSDKPQELILKKEGKGEVKAEDIKTPPEVEIVNKNLHLATLTSPKAKLEVTLEAKKGFGYLRAEEHQPELAKPGEVYLDAIFTPIVNVAFKSEEIRYKERTDYNKLTMEIESDGSIAPLDALKEALEILMKHCETMKDLLEKS